MKRLLVFTENYARGGGNRYLIDAVNSLSAEFDAVVITSNPGGIYPEDAPRLAGKADIRSVHFITKARVDNAAARLPALARRLIGLPFFLLEPLLFLYNIFASARYILRFRPTAVLSCNGGYPGGRACLAMTVASRMLGVPAVLSVVSTPMKRRGGILAVYEAATDALVWWSAKAVVVNAGAIAAALASARGLPIGKAVVVYNGLEDIAPEKKTHAGKGLTIGCIARTDRAKGVTFLLDAFIRLAAGYPDTRLVLIGKGDAQDELERRARESGLKGRIDLPGYYAGDTRALMDAIDIYVFPSLQEGFPYSILEAMRAGKAIAASSVGGIPEAITDGRDGLLVATGDTGALADAIERLMTDEALRNRLGRNARARFLKEFTLKAMDASLKKTFGEAGLLRDELRRKQ
ncbi:MAG: glycosyltransferase family 4 protein [Deltaproteobacteria bacterium]|nr:glycosyltransferase family 4 protein [Deltaproteobacteria bacterium]